MNSILFEITVRQLIGRTSYRRQLMEWNSTISFLSRLYLVARDRKTLAWWKGEFLVHTHLFPCCMTERSKLSRRQSVDVLCFQYHHGSCPSFIHNFLFWRHPFPSLSFHFHWCHSEISLLQRWDSFFIHASWGNPPLPQGSQAWWGVTFETQLCFLQKHAL